MAAFQVTLELHCTVYFNIDAADESAARQRIAEIRNADDAVTQTHDLLRENFARTIDLAYVDWFELKNVEKATD